MTRLTMPRRTLAIAVGGLLALPAAAQFGGGGAPDVELPESRQQPAETTVAAYNNPDWEPPRTSWGHPSFEGIWAWVVVSVP